MKNITKFLVVSLICLLIVMGGVYIMENKITDDSDKKYQGPVRPTDDEDYFRKTGITKTKEEIKDGR